MKKMIMICVMLVVLMLGMAGCGSSSNTSDTTSTESASYEWPSDFKVIQKLPEPEGKITDIEIRGEAGLEVVNIDIEASDASYCNTYFNACKEKGFTKIKKSSVSDGDYNYIALNKKGWKLSISNYDNEISIHLESPKYVKLYGLGKDVDTWNDDNISTENQDVIDKIEDFIYDEDIGYDSFRTTFKGNTLMLRMEVDGACEAAAYDDTKRWEEITNSMDEIAKAAAATAKNLGSDIKVGVWLMNDIGDSKIIYGTIGGKTTYDLIKH